MNEAFGVGIVGASMRSTAVLDFLQKHPEMGRVLGFYDPVPERAQCLVRHFALERAHVYPSLEALVSDARVDVVFVMSRDDTHAEGACAALAAGKHVYCEKPLAITREGCEAIRDAARGARGIFYLGMNMRHSPVYEAAHRAVEQGRLGRILTIEADEHYDGGRTYFRRWNRLRRYGGGLWITKSCHDFDVLHWLAGAPPRRVFATAALRHYRPRPEAGTHCRACPIASTCPDSYERIPFPPLWDELARLTEVRTGIPRDLCLFNSDKDTFDHGIAVIEYANGVRACYTLCVVTALTTRRLLVAGTEATLEADTAKRVVRITSRHSGTVEVVDVSDQSKGSHGGADERILMDFFDCCRTGRRPRTGAEEGWMSVRVGLAATRSSDTGLPVDLEDAEAGKTGSDGSGS